MKYDSSYVNYVYTGKDLERVFIKEFVRFRKENNLTQDVFAQFAGCSREKIARIECMKHSPSLLSLLNILGSIGYTVKIEKVVSKNPIFK
ncbi:MAG: helix-turn-helix transcriptional regulator [Bacilli bacterium]|nr:helix-turn-helix transcriptional regulator [Bacilli bacterium]